MEKMFRNLCFKEIIPTGDCAVCDKLAKGICSGCKHVFYCTRECQKKHWSSHKENCKIEAKLPYRVSTDGKISLHIHIYSHS